MFVNKEKQTLILQNHLCFVCYFLLRKQKHQQKGFFAKITKRKYLKGFRLYILDRNRIIFLRHAAIKHRLENGTGHCKYELVSVKELLVGLLSHNKLAVCPLARLEEASAALVDSLQFHLPVLSG